MTALNSTESESSGECGFVPGSALSAEMKKRPPLFGGLDKELSATLKIFIGGWSSPELKAGQLEVAGKGPPAILIRKLAVPPHVMSVA
jgi:hypothetical protein